MDSTNFSGYLAQQVDERRADSGRRIRKTAQTMRTVAGQLRGDANAAIGADWVERGAEVVDRMGAYVESTSLEQMMADAESLSRRQPWVIAAAGLATGVLAARLLKSTAARRQSRTKSST